MPRLFGEKLRRVRLERQLTQVQLAQQLGLAAHVHITKLEANKDQPSLGLAVRAAGILGVSTDYLLRDAIPVEAIVARTVIDSPDAPIPQRVGSRLKSLRLQHTLSQRDLAYKLHLASRAYISTLEAGQEKLPSIDLIVQIADLFGVTTDYLLLEPTVDDVGSHIC
jgi:transcriptional regulator with XRE-family HTH domain